MYYVYVIQSINTPKEHYVGYSENLKNRIQDHNYGKSVYANKFRPWKLLAYFGFEKIQVAKDFEAYLKTGSGRAFLKKHFLRL